jgi:hypothetical protein
MSKFKTKTTYGERELFRLARRCGAPGRCAPPKAESSCARSVTIQQNDG